MDPRDLKDNVAGNDTELHRALSESQPKWAQDGLGIRGNARQEVAQVMRSEWPDPVVSFKPAERPPPTKPVVFPKPTVASAVDVSKHPFKVYAAKDNATPPNLVLKVFPGTISNIMPTMNGARLDKLDSESDPHPWFYPFIPGFTIFLRCYVENIDAGSNYRVGVTEVKVMSEVDPLAVPDIDPATNKIIPLTMVWEGASPAEKANRTKGHFYINVADVLVSTDPVTSALSIQSIVQNLSTSLLSFAVAGDEVFPLP